jgi:hypothetical protein
MLRRCIRLLTLALVAVLLFHSQCYALCTLSKCGPQSSHCQHHSKSPSSEADCGSQHDPSVAPEGAAVFVPLLASAPLALPEVLVLLNPEHATPVFRFDRMWIGQGTGTRVLVLLSTFRI